MKKLIITIIVSLIFVYCLHVIISQQSMIDSYKKEREEYANQVEQAQEKKNELEETMNNLNSTEYIENIARDKLDMYLPNERVYIDIDK